MAKARALVKRRKAVRNIRKITRTMELIATARFKKAMDRATEAAAYTRKINEIVADLARADLSFSHPLLQQPQEQTSAALLIITSNRGFNGGYNGGILRPAVARLREFEPDWEDVSLEVSGKRGLSWFRYEGIEVRHKFTEFDEEPKFDDVNRIASRYVEDFIGGRLHRVDVAYQKFYSSSRQGPVVETLLPIGDLAADAGSAETNGRAIDYEFQPSAQEILEEIVPAAFKARLFKCFLDAAVGDQIARMVAMKAATENADEMIRDISMKYNRARQTQITSELAEIIGGAAALE